MSHSHRTWLALGLLAIVLLAGACGAAQTGPVTQGDATRGQSLWAQSACMGCHGINAQGSTGGPALADTPLTIGDVTNIVRRGGPGMPKYSASQASDQDLQDMYAWFQNPGAGRDGRAGAGPVDTIGLRRLPRGRRPGRERPGPGRHVAALRRLPDRCAPGRGGMPPFSTAQMSDQTLQAIYAWLQAQAQGPAAQQNPVGPGGLWRLPRRERRGRHCSRPGRRGLGL